MFDVPNLICRQLDNGNGDDKQISLFHFYISGIFNNSLANVVALEHV